MSPAQPVSFPSGFSIRICSFFPRKSFQISSAFHSCYGQFTEGKASPHAGRSHVHWLTGTASTVMVGCVEGILG